MAYVLATNVISPLGNTTALNYQAVKAGRSALRRYEGMWGLPEPFCASLFTDEQRAALSVHGLTRFESLVARSVRGALAGLPSFDTAAGNVLFILSTTKANVELLTPHESHLTAGAADGGASAPVAPEHDAAAAAGPAEAARRIARFLGFTTLPVVVCNACISGVSAIVLAQRLIDGGHYDYAVVCGADVQSPFTVAGFQALKVLAACPCRPFDMERNGLNLGEAAATMVMGRTGDGHTLASVGHGIIRNDAYHVSSPSKSGEGAWLALRHCLTDAGPDVPDSLAFINAHGTATMFNDQMESVAIERAALTRIPVNGLKGYYGHTLGAAGVLETVISIAAAGEGTILATRGFTEPGVSGKISVAAATVATAKTSFVKMISGFGGCNAAIIVDGGAPAPGTPAAGTTATALPEPSLALCAHRVTLSPVMAVADGKPLPQPCDLTTLYKRFVGDYPQYYKMDGLSRLGFVATELLLQAEGEQRFHECHRRAVVLMGRSSSVHADKKFLETISPQDFFPSPSLFVHTLPNIVTGEIAMRNKYHGETSFFLLPRRDEQVERQIALAAFSDASVGSVITGWTDYYDEDNYYADLSILYRQEVFATQVVRPEKMCR